MVDNYPDPTQAVDNDVFVETPVVEASVPELMSEKENVPRQKEFDAKAVEEAWANIENTHFINSYSSNKSIQESMECGQVKHINTEPLGSKIVEKYGFGTVAAPDYITNYEALVNDKDVFAKNVFVNMALQKYVHSHKDKADLFLRSCSTGPYREDELVFLSKLEAEESVIMDMTKLALKNNDIKLHPITCELLRDNIRGDWTKAGINPNDMTYASMKDVYAADVRLALENGEQVPKYTNDLYAWASAIKDGYPTMGYGDTSSIESQRKKRMQNKFAMDASLNRMVEEGKVDFSLYRATNEESQIEPDGLSL